MDQRKVAAVRQRSTDEVLPIDRRRQEATWHRAEQMGADGEGHSTCSDPSGGVMLERIKWWLSRRSRESSMQRELEAHIACEAEEQIDRGLDPAAARKAAIKAFGNRAIMMEDARRVWTWAWLEHLTQDLNYALRNLRKSPGFTAVAVGSLALGIGANTAIFSFVDAALLKPLPYPHPERIVSVWEKNPFGFSNTISTLNFLDWNRQNRCFQYLSAIAGDTMTLTGSDKACELNVQRVSVSYFKVLGVGAELGRTFASDEDQVGKDQEVVLANGIWQSRFGGDPKVIGREIMLDAKSYTVIGVLPAGVFDRTSAVMWLPLAFSPAIMTRNYHWLS